MTKLGCPSHGPGARPLPTARVRALGAGLVLAGLLPCLEFAAAQQGPSSPPPRPAAPREVESTKPQPRSVPGWLPAVVGFVTGVAGTATSVWVARRTRRGALDQSVHNKRLELYPRLVKATARLAVYFPGGDPPAASIGPKECGAMGRAMSEWYFEHGGLLLSVEARGAYFRLARALTRASLIGGRLRAPTFPEDAEEISVARLDAYRRELAQERDLDDVESWSFGGPGSEGDSPARRFRDYVFLQRLSSALRTTLSEDLRGRRRPS